jgi:tetratricopeptide (TPR) repeat protein
VTRRPAALFLALALAGATVLQAGWGWKRLQASLLVGQVQRQIAEIRERGEALESALASQLGLLQRARALDPGSLQAIAAYGDLLLLSGEPEAAAAVYRQGLALEPRAELYFNLGLALWALEEEREALEAFRAAAALDPRLGRLTPPEARERLSRGRSGTP